MITTIDYTVLEILKESLYNIPAELSEKPNQTAVFMELTSQSLLPIAYIWLKKQKDFDEDLKKDWTQVYAAQTYRWYAMMREQSDIIDLLSSNGYTVAVMKGNSIAAYYPKPQLRGSSDIDLLVRWEEYDEIYDFLLNQGYQLIGEKQEKKHHFAICGKKYVIEVHKRPGGTRLNGTTDQTDLLYFFQEGLNEIVWTDCCGYRIPVLPPVYNAMILLLHTAQHMKEGIGLRHILDWMMFAEHCVDDDFWNHKLKPVAEKGQVALLAQISTKMCQKYLGLTDSITWCKDASDQTSQDLVEYLFSQGDFGKKVKTSENGLRVVANSQGVSGFLRYVYKSSLYSMPVAKEYQLLKPVALFYQCIRYMVLIITRKNPFISVKNDLSKGRKRKVFFEQLGIGNKSD